MKGFKVVGKEVCALLFVVSILAACEKESMSYKSEYEKSYKEWLKLKAAWGDSYEYQAVVGSWTGYNSRTTITVVKGKVVRRSFTARYLAATEEWTETGSEIGMHQSVAAEPLTLDEVYSKARNEWLAKHEEASYYFETDSNGLISLCGYVDSRCQDDCLEGITIAYIEGLLSEGI